MCVWQANSNSDNMKLVAAILVAALYPNVVQVRTPGVKYSKTGEGQSRVLAVYESNMIHSGEIKYFQHFNLLTDLSCTTYNLKYMYLTLKST